MATRLFTRSDLACMTDTCGYGMRLVKMTKPDSKRL
jgi:hypothetical protein